MYKIVGVNDEPFFINETTGSLSVSRALDREDKPSYIVRCHFIAGTLVLEPVFID